MAQRVMRQDLGFFDHLVERQHEVAGNTEQLLRAVIFQGLQQRCGEGGHGSFQPILTNAPPSTGNATPVMKLASSEAKNSAALATSHAVPIFLRSGTRASRIAATSARLLPEWRARVSTAIGVSISPGRITFARMPNSAFW